jgi:regulator-associated protein of mTOR
VLWDDFDEAKGLGVRLKAHSELTAQMHQDPVPEVRASIMYALGVFIGTTAGDALTGKSNAGRSLSGSAVERTGLNEQWQADEELGVAMSTLKMQNDASPLVRRELVILLSAVVYNHRGNFVVSAYDHAMEQKAGVRRNPAEVFEERINIMEHSLRHMDSNKPSASTYSMEFRAIMFSCMYMTILDLAADPFPDVSERAIIMLDYIHEELLDSHLSLVSAAGRSDHTDSEGEEEPASAGSGLSSRNSQQHLASSMEKPKTTAAQALKALNKLGFGAPSFNRQQSSSASPALSSRSRLSPGTKLPTSKSTAHLGDLASTTRTLRHVSSADSLLQQATANAAKKSAGPSSARSSVRHPDTPLLSVAEAKALLIQNDADRLKRSRQTPAPVIVTPARTASPVPVTPNPTLPPPPVKEYVPSTTISDAQGRPRNHELPFRSELFDWSTEYFISPQMKEKEADEPGSVEYNERHWRRERNERIIVATQGLKDAAGSSRWDQLDAELDLTSTPEQIAFHQFEPHIATADTQGIIRINDWQQRRCINRFSNLVPLDDKPASADTKITTLKFVNDDDAALLLTGTCKSLLQCT